MAGVTDIVFRSICRRFGADITVSEMVSSEGLVRAAHKTESLLPRGDGESKFGVQLFGADPAVMAEAAARVEELVKPDFIDINAGCPVPKVIKRNGGAALLRDPAKFEAIVSAMVKAVKVPVTVKIRIGWTVDSMVDIEYAHIAEHCGASAVTLHARTRAALYSGKIDITRITALKKSVSIPVIGNGDITTPEAAQQMYNETGCDAIMIGRAALGNPWIFQAIKEHLNGRTMPLVSLEERCAVAREHLREFKARNGEKRAAVELKKQAVWYLKGIPQTAAIRKQIFSLKTTAELEHILSHAMSVTTEKDSNLWK
jgi:nifR3 family TIM-barrel protein